MNREPNQWEIKWKSGDKYILRNKKNGKERKVQLSGVDKQLIKNGWTLQPVGKNKDEFLKKYKYLPDVPKEETDKYLSKRGLL